MTTIADRYAAEFRQAVPHLHRVILVTGPDPRPHRSGLVLAVACTCSPYVPRDGGGRKRRVPIEARNPFPASEAIAAWRAWHENRRILL